MKVPPARGAAWPAAGALALAILAAGRARAPTEDIDRENAAIFARIDHRLGQGGGGRETMVAWRGPSRSERVVCVSARRERGGSASFIFRSGCLFTQDDLPPAVFDRWRRDFCGPPFSRPGQGPPR